MSYDWNHKLIHIKWDRICRDKDCITVDGRPVDYVTSAKIEWPSEHHGRGAALLTVTQVILSGDAPSFHESRGYLVPVDLWDAYQDWLRAERRK